MPTIRGKDITTLKKLYLQDRYCMREIAEHFNVSIDAVVYAMRKHAIPRRSMKEMNALRFERKQPSFTVSKRKSKFRESVTIAGAMLYWGEGFKAGNRCGIDFANSDPEMVRVFLLFLRSRYILDESKFRAFLYCYSDQDIGAIQRFWSILTNIPLRQFTKPYIRTDFKPGGRKMKHGLIHIRYSDKKMLLDIMSLIERYSRQFRSRRW